MNALLAGRQLFSALVNSFRGCAAAGISYYVGTPGKSRIGDFRFRPFRVESGVMV